MISGSGHRFRWLLIVLVILAAFLFVTVVLYLLGSGGR